MFPLKKIFQIRSTWFFYPDHPPIALSLNTYWKIGLKKGPTHSSQPVGVLNCKRNAYYVILLKKAMTTMGNGSYCLTIIFGKHQKQHFWILRRYLSQFSIFFMKSFLIARSYWVLALHSLDYKWCDCSVKDALSLNFGHFQAAQFQKKDLT